MIPTSTALYDPRFTGGDVRFDPATSMLMGTPQGRDAFGEDRDTTALLNPQFARLFDALKTEGTGKIGGADGLPTDDQFATLPLSLQGIAGGKYKSDDFGAPTSVSYPRR